MNKDTLRAALSASVAALPAIQSAGLAPGATPEQVKAFTDLIDKIESEEKNLALAEKAEEITARLSVPAGQVPAAVPGSAPAGTEHRGAAVPAVPAEAWTLEKTLSLAAAAVIKAGKGGDPIRTLQAEGYQGFIDYLQSKAVNTLVSAEGGILVPTLLQGGVIPLLRPATTFLQGNPTRVQLTNGAFKQPRGATGATAAYIAQGALKPVSTPTFEAIDMAAKKLAGIVLLTNEAQKWTVGNIEAYVRNDLQAALAQVMDLNAYLGTGAGASPTGILNKSGVQTHTGVFASPTAPTLAELDTLAMAMILKLTTNNLSMNGNWRWLMSYRTALRIAAYRVGGTNGELAFPEMAGAAPTWYRIPVMISNQIPTNGGGGTDETTIALIDWSHVLFGEEEGIRVAMSDQATIDVDGAGDLVHLFQQNMFALLAEMAHDFGLRYAKAVVKATAIRF
jgi:HK97 family phage major capsid protein